MRTGSIPVIPTHTMAIKEKYKNRSVSIQIPLHLYPWSVDFCFNWTDAELTKHLKKSGVSKADRKSGSHTQACSALWVGYKSCNTVLIRMKHIPETPHDYAVLQHEIFHAVAFTLELAGLQLSVGVSDEAYAYMISWLTEELYTKLNKYYK